LKQLVEDGKSESELRISWSKPGMSVSMTRVFKFIQQNRKYRPFCGNQ